MNFSLRHLIIATILVPLIAALIYLYVSPICFLLFPLGLAVLLIVAHFIPFLEKPPIPREAYKSWPTIKLQFRVAHLLWLTLVVSMCLGAFRLCATVELGQPLGNPLFALAAPLALGLMIGGISGRPVPGAAIGAVVGIAAAIGNVYRLAGQL